MISRVRRRGVRENDVEATHKSLEETESELNGDGGSRSTRLKSALGNLALRNRIKELEETVGQLTVDVEEKGVMYIKKGGVITMECREAHTHTHTHSHTHTHVHMHIYTSISLSMPCAPPPKIKFPKNKTTGADTDDLV
jgi:hypothetical protein